MPDIQITDQLDKPIEDVKVDLAQPSSLISYLKTQVLHLAVVPDFLARKDSVLSQAATKPIQFQAHASQSFQIGGTKPEIDITPRGQATIRVNASPGTNLFGDDPFPQPAVVPQRTGYVSVGFEGSIGFGTSGTKGELTFGLDGSSTIKLEYLKAFPLGADEPALGPALGRTLSCFTIPADVSDLEALGVNDIATVSGAGELTVSGSIAVAASPNPLAAVDLPLGVGSLAVQAGATAALSASFTISGSYQVRARRIGPDTVELSFLKQRGTDFEAGISAGAGVAANVVGRDLVAALLGAISTDPVGDKKLLADLQPDELQTLAGAIKSGLDHNLKASLDLALSAVTDDEAAFQYEIQPARLSLDARDAVRRALRGDLSLLTAMEDGVEADGVLAPGLRLLKSLLTKTRERRLTLKINLLGILNFLTMSELIRHSEVLTDEASGDITIKETVTGNRISAVTEPVNRSEALRKAIFDSVLVTTAYRAGKVVTLPEFGCQQVHFALHQKTSRETVVQYLRWLAALGLLAPKEESALPATIAEGGPSTCVLRTSFGDADCNSMFFDGENKLRPKEYYLEYGRQAMRALLDRTQANDALRYRIVDDNLWPGALKIGANANLGPLVGISTGDARVQYLIGDMMVITEWAAGMVAAGAMIQEVRASVGTPAFDKKREALQKKLADMVKASKMRFDEPWGMVCLYWAGGSPGTAYGRAVAQGLTIERGTAPASLGQMAGT